MTLTRPSFLLTLTLLLCGISNAQTETDNAITLYEQSKYQEAADILQQVVKTDKKDKVAWMFLGAALLRSRHESDASNAFRKGELKPKDQLVGYDKQLEITDKPRPHYTDEAKLSMVTGAVHLAVEFLPNGKIGFVHAIDYLPGGLTQECLRAARRIKFKSPEKSGSPVTTVRLFEYSSRSVKTSSPIPALHKR
jgi:hypothetical protein